MRFPLTAFASWRVLPPGRALVLTGVAVLLAVADWLPDNAYVDPDRLEFALTVVLAGAAILMTLRDRLDAADARAWRGRLVLLAITLGFTAIAAEYATRFVFRDVTTSSDFGGYFSRRWARAGAVHLNADGFRERPFTDAKPAGVYRIAVVGDSFTYGNGVRQEERYSDLLQARLPAHVEVLNFGQAGANTPEHRALVESLLRRIHPDFVLLQWYINDVEDDDSTARPRFLPLLPFRSLDDWLSVHSALYTVANMQWAESQVALGMTVSYPAYLKRRLGDPNSQDSQRDRQLLNGLITACQKAGVPIGMVLFPDTAYDMGGTYQFAYLHERVRGICAERGITCLDLRDDFSKVRDRRTLWASRLDHHPSARANAIAAERILETFSTVWVK